MSVTKNIVSVLLTQVEVELQRRKLSLNHNATLQPRWSLEAIKREYSWASTESTVNVKQVRDSKAITMWILLINLVLEKKKVEKRFRKVCNYIFKLGTNYSLISQTGKYLLSLLRCELKHFAGISYAAVMCVCLRVCVCALVWGGGGALHKADVYGYRT